MSNDSTSTAPLRVVGESLQGLYQQYVAGVFLVNRRYQRKLVWSIPEKQLLIDSMLQNLPVPLILLAEHSQGDKSGVEIIDGLQRLNAIFSFIENDFPVDGKYFDLESLGDTKYLLDREELQQHEPRMDRDQCLRIVNYRIPVSTYTAATPDSIDEVFRRINSSGRKLSLQEIRQAGVTSSLSTLVRKVSESIRRDASLRDILPLSEMSKISIGDASSGYGVDEKEIWWVKQGILDRDAIRESRDEELVLDIILDIVLETMLNGNAGTGMDYRNAAYGRGGQGGATSRATVEAKLQVAGPSKVYDDFLITHNFFVEVVRQTRQSWADLTIVQVKPRGIPRYFHALFVAAHSLLVTESQEVADWPGLLRCLNGFWNRDISISQGGSNWGAERKFNTLKAVKHQLEPYFKPVDDQATRHAQAVGSQFESHLQMALSEKSLFELKQGFCRLDAAGGFDDAAFAKMLRTASAMANDGPDASGWIFIGVADDSADAARIGLLRGVAALPVGEFYVTGTAEELCALGFSVDEMYRHLAAKIIASPLDAPFAQKLAQTLTPFKYEGKLVWSLNPTAQAEPTTFDNKFYVRITNRTEECSGRSLIHLVGRFAGGSYPS